jgi:hypothetical protein
LCGCCCCCFLLQSGKQQHIHNATEAELVSALCTHNNPAAETKYLHGCLSIHTCAASAVS